MSKRPASGLVSEIIIVTGQLIALMEQEVHSLKAGDVQALTKTRPEKGRLMRGYEAKLHALKASPTLYAAVEPALKGHLESATHKLQTAIDHNVTQLRAAAEANRRLADALAKSAVQSAAKPGYGPRSSMTPVVASRAASEPLSISRAL
jgi:flagellar biosynthesis/type III secretory pathway chaperone